MEELSSEKYVTLMLDIPDGYTLHTNENGDQEVTAINIWKKDNNTEKNHDEELEINNGVVQIPVELFEENKLRFKLSSEDIYGGNLFNIENKDEIRHKKTDIRSDDNINICIQKVKEQINETVLEDKASPLCETDIE